MRRSLLGVCAIAIVVLGVAPVVAEEPAPGHGMNYWLGGERILGVGVNVLRLHPTGSPAPGGATDAADQRLRLIDSDLRVDALAFELRLQWPVGPERLLASRLQPYLALGPALFLARPDPAAGVLPLSAPGDSSLSLGVRGGAGLSWNLSDDTRLFGEYRMIRSDADQLGLTGRRSPGGPDLDATDFVYGVSVRF